MDLDWTWTGPGLDLDLTWDLEWDLEWDLDLSLTITFLLFIQTHLFFRDKHLIGQIVTVV